MVTHGLGFRFFLKAQVPTNNFGAKYLLWNPCGANLSSMWIFTIITRIKAIVILLILIIAIIMLILTTTIVKVILGSNLHGGKGRLL